jgi:hypothetical protein
LITQLEYTVTKLDERVSHLLKHLGVREDLIGDSRDDAGKSKDTIRRCGQERGILKRPKEEGDNEYQLVDCMQRRKKRKRVTWKEES